MANERLPASERKRQILRAALRVFARSGFHGSTTREIAREAGVAEALLYRYFDTKHALFAHAVRLTSERLVAGLRHIAAEHPNDPTAAIRQLLAFSQRMMETNAHLAKMVFVVGAELDDPVIREAYLPHQEEAIRVIASAVDQWKRVGAVHPHLPSVTTAWLIFGCFELLALRSQCGLPTALPERDLQGLLGLFVSSGSRATEARTPLIETIDPPDPPTAASGASGASTPAPPPVRSPVAPGSS